MDWKWLPRSDGARRVLQKTAHAWFLASRGLTLGVRAAILDGSGRVFLIRHTYAAGWQFPGGGVEIGETAIEALRREVAEEAEIALLGPPSLHGSFLNRHVSRRDHVLVYVVRDFRVVRPKTPDREIAEAAFWPLADLPDATTRGTRDRLDEIASGRGPAECW